MKAHPQTSIDGHGLEYHINFCDLQERGIIIACYRMGPWNWGVVSEHDYMKVLPIACIKAGESSFSYGQIVSMPRP